MTLAQSRVAATNLGGDEGGKGGGGGGGGEGIRCRTTTTAMTRPVKRTSRDILRGMAMAWVGERDGAFPSPESTLMLGKRGDLLMKLS